MRVHYLFSLLILLGLALPLVLTSQIPSLYWVWETAPYLLFHNSAEFFSIAVSISIFGLGWFSYRRSQNRHALFLSASFLALGILDFLHTLSFEGMPALITPNTLNKAAQFWIAARFVGAAAFLLSAFVPSKPQKPWRFKLPLLLICLFLPVLTLVGITFFPDRIPMAFVVGVGLTPFKILTEYTIIVVLSAAFLSYLLRWKKTSDPTIPWYLAAFATCVVSELTFTFFKGSYDTYNFLGHVYKILAFVLIYRGIFVSSITQPYDRLQTSILEKETLLKELYHRTKNTLQMVRGMLVLQAGDYGDDERIASLISKTDDRIQAVSLVHEKLLHSPDLSRIPLKGYVEDLVGLLIGGQGETGRVLFKTEIEDGLVLFETAVPFGLILNELVTNSLKHGFPGGQNGMIRISVEQPLPTRVRLTYSDNGVGLPEGWDLKLQESLGMQLIRTIAEGQLKGNIKVAGGPGFTCTVEFPTCLYHEKAK